MHVCRSFAVGHTDQHKCICLLCSDISSLPLFILPLNHKKKTIKSTFEKAIDIIFDSSGGRWLNVISLGLNKSSLKMGLESAALSTSKLCLRPARCMAHINPESDHNLIEKVSPGRTFTCHHLAAFSASVCSCHDIWPKVRKYSDTHQRTRAAHACSHFLPSLVVGLPGPPTTPRVRGHTHNPPGSPFVFFFWILVQFPWCEA